MNHENLLIDLIEIKSLSRKEEKLRGFIKNWFEAKGIEAFEQDENLVVHFKGTDKTRAFIFNSHMDTIGVDEGDMKLWETNPWEATKKDNKIVGLGASDMKAGLAASMLLAEKYSTSEEKPPVDMWFTYVVREEVDGGGSNSFAEWFEESGNLEKYQEVAAIFTEPTNLAEVEYGHRGNIFIKVTAEGEGGHASRPFEIKGTTAIRKMVTFADNLAEAVGEWREEYQNEFFEESITVGEFSAIYSGVIAREVEGKDGSESEKGDDEGGKYEIVPVSANKIPTVCIAVFDVRTIEEFHSHALGKLIELGEEVGVKVETLEEPAPAGFTHPSEKIVKAALEVRTEKPRKLTISLASADLGFFTAKGISGVVFGPGDKSVIHAPNEYTLPEQIPLAVDIYHATVKAWAD